MKNINIFIFLLYVVVAVTPSLTNVYYLMALMLVWMCSLFLMGYQIQVDYKIPIFFWIVYAILLRFINYSSAPWGNYGLYLLFYFPLFVFDFYRNFLEKKELIFLCKLVVLLLCVNVIQNICVLIMYPGATIQLNFSNEYAGLNLGNSSFTFAVMLTLLICFWLALKKKWEYVLISALGVFYLFLSSKTTALLVFVIFAMLFLADKLTNKASRLKKIFVMLSMIVIIPILFFEILPLLQMISGNEYINNRIDAVLAGNTKSEYMSRIGLAKISFDSFLSNPIFGIGFVKADFAKVVYYTLGIGHHSEFIDHLGRYGLVGFFFYAVIFAKFWQFLVRIKTKSDDFMAASFVVLSFLVFSVLNNSMDYISGIVLFFLVPAVSCGCFDECDENKMVIVKGK